jgi:hypothetical protein
MKLNLSLQPPRAARSGPALFGSDTASAVKKTGFVVPPKTAPVLEPVESAEVPVPAPQSTPELPAEVELEAAPREEAPLFGAAEAEFPSVPELVLDPAGDVAEQLERAAQEADQFLRTCFELAFERARREAAQVHAQHLELAEELRRLRKRGTELEAGNDRVRKMLRQ